LDIYSSNASTKTSVIILSETQRAWNFPAQAAAGIAVAVLAGSAHKIVTGPYSSFSPDLSHPQNKVIILFSLSVGSIAAFFAVVRSVGYCRYLSLFNPKQDP